MDESAPYTAYTKELYRSKGVKFNGLHAAIQRGKTRTDLQEFSSYKKIENTLSNPEDFGCTIIDEECALCQNTEIINSLIESKGRENYKEKQAQHDLALIDWCKKNRSRNVSTVKDAKSWVLTNDIRLTNWNKKNTKSSIQECITETQLCHLLWIEEPKTDGNGMISTILALANRNSVNNMQIEAFLKNAEAYKQKLETASEIDMFTLAFNSDAITTQDILNAYPSENDFDNLIKNKAKSHKEESQRKDELIKKQQNEQKIIIKQKEISDIEKDIAITEKEVSDLKLENYSLQSETEKLDSKKIIYKREKRNSNRKTAGIFLLVVLICISIALISFPQFKSLSITLIEKENIATILSIVFETVISIIYFVVSYFLTLLIILLTGEQIKIKELFSFISNCFFNRAIRKKTLLQNFDEETCNNTIKENTTKLDENYNLIKQKNNKLLSLHDKLSKIYNED